MSFLFDKSGSDRFIPRPLAAGPFQNVHGGAGAALMFTHATKLVPIGFVPVSQRTDYLKSTPLEEFSVSHTEIKQGRSQYVVDVAIHRAKDSAVTARSTISFYKPSNAPSIEDSEEAPWGGQTDPESLGDLPDRPAPFGGTWMLNATDVRTDLGGTYWFRLRGTLTSAGDNHWFGRVIAVADWVSGFVSPGFPDPSRLSVWPNTDLTLQVEREHVGEWIGIRPIGHYRSNGIGLGRGEVYDQNGLVGHVLTNTIGPASAS